MRVKVFMMPLKKVQCIELNHTLGEAMEIINDQKLLSLPVVHGTKFIGVLSKQHTYETFFNDFKGTKEEFLNQEVEKLMKETVETVSEDTDIEVAAAQFISSRSRFIPVTSESGDLLGIVTQQAVFREYQKLFGPQFNSVTVITHDYKGALSRITDVIAKANGNIKNLVQVDTEVMGLLELHIAIESDHFQAVVAALEKNAFDVRSVRYVEK
ncbi:MAG: CBS domain-containing protein [Lachnospiraceae bacterium]